MRSMPFSKFRSKPGVFVLEFNDFIVVAFEEEQVPSQPPPTRVQANADSVMGIMRLAYCFASAKEL
jgi:hypothetical protein